jgi:hypothetical protein
MAKDNHTYKQHVREVIEIIKQPNKLNKEGGLYVSNNWIPLIQMQRDSHRRYEATWKLT